LSLVPRTFESRTVESRYAAPSAACRPRTLRAGQPRGRTPGSRTV